MLSGLTKNIHPAVRAGLTSATIMAAGDVMCQKLQKRSLHAPIDWKRAGRFAVVGLAVHGPFFFYGFKWLDTVIKGEPGLKTALTKTALGQVTLFPVYLGSCLIALKVLEGEPVEVAAQKVASMFVPTYVAGSVFWPAANLFNFMFIASSGRIAYVNAAGLVWNTYLSLVNSQQPVEASAADSSAKPDATSKKPGNKKA